MLPFQPPRLPSQRNPPPGSRNFPVSARLLLLGVVLAFITTVAPSPVALVARQTPSGKDSPQPGIAFRIDIDYVNVDVTVTNERGDFVPDLGLQDFEVYEDGKRQQVSTFALVDMPAKTPIQAIATTSTPVEPDVQSNHDVELGRRVYVLVLDDLHVHPLRSAQVKRVARQFIEQHLGPNDLTAVLHTSGQANASQEFTTSRRLLFNAVDKFTGRKLRSSVLERLEEYERRQGERTRADIRLDRIADPLDAQRADQARRMLESLTSLGDVLSRAPGRRKAVLLVSEGVDYGLDQGVAQTRSGLTTLTSPDAPDVVRELRQAIRAAARANIGIYAIDPRGLVGAGDEIIEVSSFPDNPHLGLTPTAFQDEVRQAQDSLRTLSEQTGGLASISSNDFDDAFGRIVRDSSRYYLLGYRSNNQRQDGRYRQIEVRVTRPGVRVRSRSGYVVGPASKQPELLTSALEPSARLRDALNSPLPLATVPLRAFAAAFRGPKEASVSVGVEIDARNFRFERKNGLYVDKLEVGVIALGQQAKLKPGDRQTINLTLKPETYAALQAHGLRVLFRLDLPPGRFQLRVAAHEWGAGAAGSLFYDLEVPDLNQAPLAMSGLSLTSTRAGRMPTVRPDPRFEGVLPSQPTGARTFHSDETLVVFCEVYQGARVSASAVVLTTIVRGADKLVRFKSEQQVSEDELGGAGAGFGSAVRIPLADLPPGPYTLSVEARARDVANRVVVREVPLEISASDAADKQ